MFDQVTDFIDESNALYDVLKDVSTEQLATPTQFKGWNFEEIIGHLHMWNRAAELSLRDEPALLAFMSDVFKSFGGGGLRVFETKWRGNLSGHALTAAWHDFLPQMESRFGSSDPKRRVKWAGPDMSVRSSITARLMETWAHGQAIYDQLGLERVDTDRIKNIAVLGVNTFGWTFTNRNLTVPEHAPYIKLHAPSGAIWEWHTPGENECIEGSATGFCQTVTQTRNIIDTDLRVVGDTARQWMSIAQCFAGGPEEPPAPGTRHRRVIGDS